MMSADPYMLIGKGVGSSSEEETVIVAANGHPVNLHHFYAPVTDWGGTAFTRQLKVSSILTRSTKFMPASYNGYYIRLLTGKIRVQIPTLVPNKGCKQLKTMVCCTLIIGILTC